MSDPDPMPAFPPKEAAHQQTPNSDQQQHPSTHKHTVNDRDDDNDKTAPPPPPPPPPPLPPLEPFFTLLTNTSRATTIHPRVRYLFSDDDPSALASQALSRPSSSSSPCPSDTRPLIVDIVPSPDNTSWSVSWASSLSPHFALTGSSITVQHHDDAHPSAAAAAAAAEDKSTTLRLEGVERQVPEGNATATAGSGSGAAVGREDVEALAGDFRRRIGVLRKVVGECERRRVLVEGEGGSRRGEEQKQARNDAPPRQTDDEVVVGGDAMGGEERGGGRAS